MVITVPRLNIFSFEAGEFIRLGIQELLEFKEAIRNHETQITGYVNRIHPTLFLIRGGLFSIAGAILAYLPRDVAEPPENARVTLDVTWEKFVEQREGKIHRYYKVRIHKWKLAKRPIIPLPYDYEEFKEIFWKALRTDFLVKQEYEMGRLDLQDILVSNIISSPPLELTKIGGIFTTHLIPPQTKSISQRFLARIKSLIPEFKANVNLQGYKVNLDYYNLKTIKGVIQGRMYLKEREKQVKQIKEVSVNHSYLLRKPSFFEADLTLVLPANIKIPKPLPEHLESYQYEIGLFLTACYHNIPEIQLKDNELGKLLENLITRTLEKEDFPQWAIGKHKLIDYNRLSTQLLRMSLNDARKYENWKLDKQLIHDEINKFLGLAHHTVNAIQEVRRISRDGKENIRVTGLQNSLIKIYLDMQASKELVTLQEFMQEAFKRLKSPHQRIEQALEKLMHGGVFYVFTTRGVKYIKMA